MVIFNIGNKTASGETPEELEQSFRENFGARDGDKHVIVIEDEQTDD